MVFFNYGVDTGTVWKTLPFHEPIRWRHISWGRQCPDREIKESCRWGWLYYGRVKTGKPFWRPMNRTVRLHLKSLRPEQPDPDAPIFQGGGSRPNQRFRQLCELADVVPKRSIESGKENPGVLKDLRKTCATLLRRARPGILCRDPRTRCGRNHLPPLRSPGTAGASGDYDDAAADRVPVARTRLRRPMSMLSPNLPRSRRVIDVAKMPRDRPGRFDLTQQRSHPNVISLVAFRAFANYGGSLEKVRRSLRKHTKQNGQEITFP